MTSRSKPVRRRRCIPWTQAETDRLEMLAGTVPLPEVIQRYNSWAVRQRPPLPHRSTAAIWRHACRQRISLRCCGDKLTISDAASLLGVTFARIRRWTKLGYLRTYNYGWVYVARADLVAMAWERPELFCGISWDRLYQLLEDEGVCHHIARAPGYRVGPLGQRRVRCVETGQVFPSFNAAGAAVCRNKFGISRAVRTGWAVGGRHWEIVA